LKKKTEKLKSQAKQKILNSSGLLAVPILNLLQIQAGLYLLNPLRACAELKKKGINSREKKKTVTREARWRWRKTVPEERERSNVGVPRTAIGRQESPILRNKPNGSADNI
jgi:hypothetical protein